jgi:predicted alpha-1,2-mannosidase
MLKKPGTILISALLSLSLSFSQSNKYKMDFTQYVNPFIGTGGHGHTYPGASLPFGMVQLSPDTRLTGWDGCSGYHYSDSIIYGFSHMHLSGTGVPDYCDILVMPVVGDVAFANYAYASPFSHAKEFASPGFYSVYLDKYKVKADLTVTQRAGFHRYTFPKTDKAGFIIDLKHREEVLESSIEIIGNNEIRGMHRTRGWAQNKYVYFVMKFSKPFKKVLIAENDTGVPEITKAEGKNIKALVSFDTKEGEVIYVKTGISAVSIDGALKNLETEIPEWNFDKIRQQAKEKWNTELRKIKVQDDNSVNKMIFYSALYHCLLAPNIYTDVDGQFRGTDLNIHHAEGFTNYTVFSLWDTYRAEHPLLTIIDTKRTNDFINTFLAEYRYGGMLPVWELSGNETFCMIGYHSVPVIVDAYMKGIRGYGIQDAYDAIKNTAEGDRFGLDSYRKYGFVPQDKEIESVSKTLEYAYDDWCISQMAKDLGKMTDFGEFNWRAQFYKNVFDLETGFMRAKVNGGWYKPFDPQEVNNCYTEANAWQYSFYVPQDIAEHIGLLGGKEKYAQKLDELFSTESNLSGTQLEDISGLIGQYAHGNEPSHHMAYLYDYVNQPWKTQELVHKIQTDFYKNEPDGLIGNEDCGQMSAWHVLSALGFYPVCPGQMQYAIGTPHFKKVTINLENGKKFIIKAKNISEQKYYIQSAELNGKPYNKSYILHSDIMSGGELVFTMGPVPNRNWGSGDNDVPFTAIKESFIVPVPVIESEGKVFRNSQTISITSMIPGSAIYFSTDGSEPYINSPIYTSPFQIDKNTEVNAFVFVPEMGKSLIITANFFKIPEGRTVKLNSQYASKYSAGGPDGLIDGVRGDRDWRLGTWQGYKGQDFEAVVDLGEIKNVKKISAEFLEDVQSRIRMPVEIAYSVSKDGINFEDVMHFKNNIQGNLDDTDIVIKDYPADLNIKTRFIKVHAKNIGKIPGGQPGYGSDAWIFIDEIIIE